MGNVWQQQAPTVPGYYWVRYVDIQGIPKEPDIMWLVEEGRAFEFGCEHSWTPGVGCFEYGPKIEPPNALAQGPGGSSPGPAGAMGSTATGTERQ